MNANIDDKVKSKFQYVIKKIQTVSKLACEARKLVSEFPFHHPYETFRILFSVYSLDYFG